MKKVNIYMLMSLMLSMLSFSLEAASNDSASKQTAHSTARDTTSTATEEDDEYDILERDQIDSTNTLAIPFDDSEVEDEEEIDRDEDRDIFHLPHSR